MLLTNRSTSWQLTKLKQAIKHWTILSYIDCCIKHKNVLLMLYCLLKEPYNVTTNTRFGFLCYSNTFISPINLSLFKMLAATMKYVTVYHGRHSDPLPAQNQSAQLTIINVKSTLSYLVTTRFAKRGELCYEKLLYILIRWLCIIFWIKSRNSHEINYFLVNKTLSKGKTLDYKSNNQNLS